jgi:hypothetical protein
MQNQSHHHSGHDHQSLINTLLECAQACEKCMAACLEEKNVERMAHCIELDRDCAEVCFLGAKLLMRDSELAHSYLVECEEACRICAEECSNHEHEHCKACAAACRRCEQACHDHHEQQAMA